MENNQVRAKDKLWQNFDLVRLLFAARTDKNWEENHSTALQGKGAWYKLNFNGEYQQYLLPSEHIYILGSSLCLPNQLQYGLCLFFFKSCSNFFALRWPISTGRIAVSSAFFNLTGRLPTYLPKINSCRHRSRKKTRETNHPFPSKPSRNLLDPRKQQNRI